MHLLGEVVSYHVESSSVLHAFHKGAAMLTFNRFLTLFLLIGFIDFAAEASSASVIDGAHEAVLAAPKSPDKPQEKILPETIVREVPSRGLILEYALNIQQARKLIECIYTAYAFLRQKQLPKDICCLILRAAPFADDDPDNQDKLFLSPRLKPTSFIYRELTKKAVLYSIRSTEGDPVSTCKEINQLDVEGPLIDALLCHIISLVDARRHALNQGIQIKFSCPSGSNKKIPEERYCLKITGGECEVRQHEYALIDLMPAIRKLVRTLYTSEIRKIISHSYDVENSQDMPPQSTQLADPMSWIPRVVYTLLNECGDEPTKIWDAIPEPLGKFCGDWSMLIPSGYSIEPMVPCNLLKNDVFIAQLNEEQKKIVLGYVLLADIEHCLHFYFRRHSSQAFATLMSHPHEAVTAHFCRNISKIDGWGSFPPISHEYLMTLQGISPTAPPMGENPTLEEEFVYLESEKGLEMQNFVVIYHLFRWSESKDGIYPLFKTDNFPCHPKEVAEGI